MIPNAEQNIDAAPQCDFVHRLDPDTDFLVSGVPSTQNHAGVCLNSPRQRLGLPPDAKTIQDLRRLAATEPFERWWVL